MPGTTTKGYPFSLGSDTADTIDTTMQLLAEKTDARPGVSALSSVSRDGLEGAAELWDGRLIWNVTTARIERYNVGTASWIVVANVDDFVKKSGGDTITANAPLVVPLVVKGANATATVTTKALTTNVATLTTTAAHGFIAGRQVVVSGVDATFNGTYTIASVPTTTTFTYAKTAANVASVTSGGTATADVQTANLAEFQNSAGGVVATVTHNGSIVSDKDIIAVGGLFAANAPYMDAGLNVRPISNSPAIKGLVVRGAASQTANLAEFQNSVGTVLSSVTPSGAFIAPSGSIIGSTSTTLTTPSPTVQVLSVRGAANQTADLIQLQTANGTVLGGFGSSGELRIHVPNVVLNKAVTAGAVDSAGAGFRLLACAN